MSNMSYCRFENTSKDLSDCEAHILDNLDHASDYERRARIYLINHCVGILEALGYNVEAPLADGRPMEIEAIVKGAQEASSDDEEDDR